MEFVLNGISRTVTKVALQVHVVPAWQMNAGGEILISRFR